MCFRAWKRPLFGALVWDASFFGEVGVYGFASFCLLLPGVSFYVFLEGAHGGSPLPCVGHDGLVGLCQIGEYRHGGQSQPGCLLLPRDQFSLARSWSMPGGAGLAMLSVVGGLSGVPDVHVFEFAVVVVELCLRMRVGPGRAACVASVAVAVVLYFGIAAGA